MTVAGLLLLALMGPLDRIEELLEEEQFEEAYAMLAEADADDPRFALVRNRAICGVARDLQRAKGFRAAIDFLEPRADTPDLMTYYALTCSWAGEEQRGLDKLRRLPEAKRRAYANAEMELLFSRRDFAALERRAKEIGWEEWETYARNERELRERFAERTRRGAWVALGGVGLIVALLVWFTRSFATRPAS